MVRDERIFFKNNRRPERLTPIKSMGLVTDNKSRRLVPVNQTTREPIPDEVR